MKSLLYHFVSCHIVSCCVVSILVVSYLLVSSLDTVDLVVQYLVVSSGIKQIVGVSGLDCGGLWRTERDVRYWSVLLAVVLGVQLFWTFACVLSEFA